jgi:hypothetical protein
VIGHFDDRVRATCIEESAAVGVDGVYVWWCGCVCVWTKQRRGVAQRQYQQQ